MGGCPARGVFLLWHRDITMTSLHIPEGPEEFYVLSEAALAKPESLERHKEQLLCGEPVRATLIRQRRVFRPSPMASQFDLPPDFFNLTTEEAKREQKLRSEAVERLSMLRTKAMREKEEQREMRKYTYTLLRVRLPDGCLLQGEAWEVASAVGLKGVVHLQLWVAVPPAGVEGLSGLSFSGHSLSGVPRISSPTLTVPPLRDLLCPGAGGSTL